MRPLDTNFLSIYTAFSERPAIRLTLGLIKKGFYSIK